MDKHRHQRMLKYFQPIDLPVITALIFVALCLLILAATYSQRPSPGPAVGGQQEQPQSTPATQHGQTELRGTAQAPLVVETHEGGPGPEIAAQQAEDRDQQTTNEYLLIGTNVLLGLFTLGVVIYTSKLWRATERLVRGAEDTAKRQLRAYVNVKRPSIKDVVGGSTKITLSCKFENFGQTPAYGVVCASIAYVEPYPPAKLYAVGGMGPGSQLDLGPRASGTINAYLDPLSPADILDIRKETKSIYFRGNIEYRDTFGKKQTTEFMLMKKGPKFDDATDDTMAVCHIGNSAT